MSKLLDLLHASYRSLHPAALVMLMIFTAGCATEAVDAPADDTAAQVPEADPLPEVFFANIEDGGAYSSPVEIIFGVENFNIVPIEDPLVVREGEGHYHLAVDVPCADAGEIIVAGNPSYIHFGTGNDRIEMQFEPGEHTLCLQVADGEHRVINGPRYSNLTKDISITIE
jgi:hypothetical protein